MSSVRVGGESCFVVFIRCVLTAAPGGSVAMLSLRRNLDMDAVLLAIAGDFHLLGRV